MAMWYLFVKLRSYIMTGTTFTYIQFPHKNISNWSFWSIQVARNSVKPWHERLTKWFMSAHEKNVWLIGVSGRTPWVVTPSWASHITRDRKSMVIWLGSQWVENTCGRVVCIYCRFIDKRRLQHPRSGRGPITPYTLILEISRNYWGQWE